MALEFVKPERETGESMEDYMYRYGCAIRLYNTQLCHSIDRTIGAGYVSQSTMDAPKRGPKTSIERSIHARPTLADFLADRPHLLEEFKAGRWSPFDL